MARTTPAQNPRGEHSSTLSGGFCGSGHRCPGIAPFGPIMQTWAAPPCPVKRGKSVASRGVKCLYSGHFPVIIDDWCFARKGGRSARGDLPMATSSPADAEGDRRLAGGQHRAVVRPDRRILQAASAGGESDRRRRRRAGHQGPRSDPDRAVHPRADRRGRGRPEHKLQLSAPKVDLPEPKTSGKKGPRYTPVSRRQDRPNAILWLVRNHPELKDARSCGWSAPPSRPSRRSATAPTGTPRR